jgi:hypothetical protein
VNLHGYCYTITTGAPSPRFAFCCGNFVKFIDFKSSHAQHAIGLWHDTVSLAGPRGTNLAATMLVAQNTVLGAGQSYAESASVVVPGRVDGNYQYRKLAGKMNAPQITDCEMFMRFSVFQISIRELL